MSNQLQDRPTTEDEWYDSLRQREATDTQVDNKPARDEMAGFEQALTGPSATDEQRRANGTRTPGTPASTSHMQSIRNRFQGSLSGFKKRSPLLAIALFVGGGGSAFLITLAPGMPILMLADILDRDLNTQLSAVDKTSNQLWRSKLKGVTSGQCGVVKLRCKFATVNTEKMEKTLSRVNASSPDKLLMTFDNDAGFGDKRGRIKTVTLIQENGTKFEAKTADDLTKLMKKEPAFRSAMYMVYSPKFSVYKGKAVIDFLNKNKISYAPPDKKKTKQEMRDELNKRVKGESDISTKKLTPVTDKDGKETGEYKDDDGKIYSAEEAKGIQEFDTRLKAAPSVGELSKSTAKGLLPGIGVADTACTVNNTATAVRVAAKTLQAGEMMRLAFYNVIQPSSMIRAEMADPTLVEAAAEPIMDTTPAGKVADESKMDSIPNGQAVPQIDNPRAGRNATDAELIKVSSANDYGGIKNMSMRSKSLLTGGDRLAMIGTVQQKIASALGASSPREISRICKNTVQNSWVRGGALVLGIAVGLGTFGIGTAFSLAGSFALAAMMPWLTSQLADIAAGRVTEGLKQTDLGNGIAIGADNTYNGMARAQGMMTMSPDNMTDYQNGKREALQAYDEIDQLAAKKNPFDTTNKFSFLGSLARTTMPFTNQLQQGGAGVVSSLSTLTSLATTSAIPFAHADDAKWLVKKDRYTYCNDPDYAELGPNVAINPTCVMVFGLPKEAMNIDPEENLDWMLANDEIIPDSDSGDPKDNGRDWNYKKYLEQCVEQQPGATEDIEADPTNGAGCTSQANYEKNWHYAKFKLSLGINDGIDQDLPGLDGGSQNNFDTGEKGQVSQDGWSYPTDKSKTTVSSGFGMRDGTRHNGIDLAGPLGTPIFAAREGTVIAAGPAEGFGNWIVLRHEVEGKRVDTVYGHMAANGVLVKRGDTVKAGQMIGKIGNEGQSTGPHLHFEVWPGGRPDMDGGSGDAVDPKPYLDKATGGSQ